MHEQSESRVHTAAWHVPHSPWPLSPHALPTPLREPPRWPLVSELHRLAARYDDIGLPHCWLRTHSMVDDMRACMERCASLDASRAQRLTPPAHTSRRAHVARMMHDARARTLLSAGVYSRPC